MSEVDMSLTGPDGAVISDVFAEYAGRVYPVVSPSQTSVHLTMDAATAERDFPGVETRPSRGGFVKVEAPKSALDRYVDRSIIAWWKGKHRVYVEALVGDRALIIPDVGPKAGLELGLSGDPYMGWAMEECPVSELRGLEQEITELRLL